MRHTKAGFFRSLLSTDDLIRRTLLRQGDCAPMPPITALLHTSNDAKRLGRTLETLLPCSEILIVDHGSTDTTRRIAHPYAARIVDAETSPTANHFLDLARCDWILCLEPGESMTEALQASLFEWSTLPNDSVASHAAFSVYVREQKSETWLKLPAPETRLVPRTWRQWHDQLPAPEPSAVVLEGELLRFFMP